MVKKPKDTGADPEIYFGGAKLSKKNSNNFYKVCSIISHVKYINKITMTKNAITYARH